MGVIPIHPPGSLPEPATPALGGAHWWHARTSVLEGQRQAYADEVAGKDRTIAEQAETIARLKAEVARYESEAVDRQNDSYERRERS